jgi:hypothetical protein
MHGAKAAVVLLMLLFFTPLHANVVAPTIYEQADMGDDIHLTQFTYAISVDCSLSAISVVVMDNHNNPVEGAHTYLKYVDFSTPLIAQGTTDSKGFILEKLPGSTQIMRGLFILVIEKTGFLNKEVHFDISGCYSNASATPPPATKPPANSTMPNKTQNNGTAAQPFNYSSAPPANASGAADNATASRASGLSLNATGVAVLGVVALGLAVVSIMVLKLIRKMQVRKKWGDGKT